jgi:Zn-dependent M28 family amino/carboxypeptidase
VRVATFTAIESVATENILADSPFGSADEVVLVGAHLDSVPEGPGINDNGSGSAAILEIALELTKTDFEGELQNKVRFAFWGAEELGLLGSQYYVDNLSEEELAKIKLNLNFDMVGSPNYVRFVYDGDNSLGTGVEGPAGSAEIEEVFVNYFESRGLASEPTEFSGRSDYGPFLEAGIPAGGLFSGAEGIKTEEQAEIYGGLADVPYDPCYHLPCDSLFPSFEFFGDEELEALYRETYDQLAQEYPLRGNVNVQALEELSDAAAFATLYFIQNDLMDVQANSLQAQGVGSSSAMLYRGHHVVR